MAAEEPALAGFIHATILKHDRLENALSYHLARKLGGGDLDPLLARETFEEALAAMPGSARRSAPTCRRCSSAILPAIPLSRPFSTTKAFMRWRAIASAIGSGGRTATRWRCSSRAASPQLFAVDIHPAAKLGRGIMIDHATGVVIGETAVVEDDVSMLHGVTLGGTGKDSGDRHPKIRRGVLLSMGAKILGNIEIGEYSRVGAGSVVLKSVPPGCTAVGVPAKLVNCAGPERPSQEMNHFIDDRMRRAERAGLTRPWSGHATSRPHSHEDSMTRGELWRLEKYLRNLFRLDTITVVERPKQQDSVEVHINGEFVGVLFKDEEDGEVSYAFNMAILEMDLPEPPASRAG